MSRTLTCPECKFSREIPAGQIPPRAVRATCPKCGSRFSVDGGASAATPPEREIWMLAPALRRGLVLCAGVLLLVLCLMIIPTTALGSQLPMIWLVFAMTAVLVVAMVPFIFWRLKTPLYELTPEAFTARPYPFKVGSCQCSRAKILGIINKEQTHFGVKVRQASLVIGGRGERLREMKVDLMRSERPEQLVQRLQQSFPPLTAATLIATELLQNADNSEIEHNDIILSRDGIAIRGALIPWPGVQSITTAGLVVSGYGELIIGYGSAGAMHTLKIPPRTNEQFVTFVRTLLFHAPQATIDPAVARIVDCPPKEARQETMVWLLLVAGFFISYMASNYASQYAPTLTSNLIFVLLSLFGGTIPLFIGLMLALRRFYGWQPRTPAALAWGTGGCCVPVVVLLLLFGFVPTAWQMLQGDWAMNRGDLVAAEQHFTAALAEAPENNTARHALGLAYLEQKNYQAAFDCFEKIYLTRETLGMEKIPETLLKMERYDEALAWCDRISADHPKQQKILKEIADKRLEILRLKEKG